MRSFSTNMDTGIIVGYGSRLIHGTSESRDVIYIGAQSKIWNLSDDQIISHLREIKSQIEYYGNYQDVEWLMDYCLGTRRVEDREPWSLDDSQIEIIRLAKVNPLVSQETIETLTRVLKKIDEFNGLQADMRHIRKRTRRAVLERDGWKCRYCGADVSNGGHIDHVIPFSRGGKTVIDNLVSACKSCNMKKRARTPEEAGMVMLEIGEVLNESA